MLSCLRWDRGHSSVNFKKENVCTETTEKPGSHSATRHNASRTAVHHPDKAGVDAIFSHTE